MGQPNVIGIGCVEWGEVNGRIAMWMAIVTDTTVGYRTTLLLKRVKHEEDWQSK